MSSSEKKIPLVEAFGPTIQGEGALCGVQTYFLRFGLCDYKCLLCDSMHAVDPFQVMKNAQRLTQSEILNHFTESVYKEGSTRWITFSGGNPCIHDLTDLVENLNLLGFKVAVETQGTKCPEWLQIANMVTISPKGPGMGETFEPDLLANMLVFLRSHDVPHCVKVVVFDERDLEFARSLIGWFTEQGTLDVAKNFYLSLGNPYPPGYHEEQHPESFTSLVMESIGRYKMLFEDIQTDPQLSRARWLPQLHHWVWGNEKGK